MKIGLFWDQAIRIKSYYVKDGTAYDFENNQPYSYHHSITPQCFSATHNFPFLWGDGYFINVSEWDELPDLDLDLILYANERSGLDDITKERYSVKRIKNKYPKAKIVGYTKEVYVKPERKENRIEFFKSCDAVYAEAVTTMKHLDEYKNLEILTNKKFDFNAQPLNIDYFYDNFYSDEKINGIYAYLPNPQHRRGRTYEFAKYIGEKYNIPVKFKSLQPGQKFDYLSQKDFIKMWSPYLYNFNLDPIPLHPGGQCIQVASVGSINFGGVNESHTILYPETATCDEQILEEKFIEYQSNPEKQFEVIQNAWIKLNEIYSFNSVKNQLKKLYS
tara:strand:+ start:309 stop:1304 length:996 start_codon:yes stop_codon:yes gene_type:complete